MVFQIAAVVILIMFYGCYSAKLISQRKKGIRTDQLGKDKVGFVRFIEVTLKIATYLAAAAEVVSIAMQTSCFPASVRIAGIFIGAIGIIVFIVSVLTMRDSWRAGVSKTDKTELITDGIYRFSRNPAFLAFDLVYLGILLMFFNKVLFAISIFAAIMLHLQIVNVEEDFLMEMFGESYLEYKRSVHRYLGRR